MTLKNGFLISKELQMVVSIDAINKIEVKNTIFGNGAYQSKIFVFFKNNDCDRSEFIFETDNEKERDNFSLSVIHAFSDYETNK